MVSWRISPGPLHGDGPTITSSPGATLLASQTARGKSCGGGVTARHMLYMAWRGVVLQVKEICQRRAAMISTNPVADVSVLSA